MPLNMYSFSNVVLWPPVILLSLLALYYWADDIIRLIKFTAYQCRYGSYPGEGIIPGPAVDTRFKRFADGLQMAISYRQKYGSIYRVFCGTTPEIVITDPNDVRMFYSDARAHTRAPNMGFGDYIGRVLGECVGVKFCQDWHRLRTHIDRHFSPSVSIKLLPDIIADTAEWVAKLPLQSGTTQHTLDRKTLQVLANKLVPPSLPLKIIARILFANLLTDDLFVELCQCVVAHERLMARSFFGKLEQWSLISHLPTKANRDMMAFLQQWEALMIRTAQKAEEQGESTTVSELYKAVQEGNMSFLEFSQSVDEVIFNNIDVVNNAISWAAVLIAQHPEAQRRLGEEIDAVLSTSSPQPNVETIAAYLRKTDTYLHHCTLEAGRLQPTSWYALPEITSQPKVLGGYTIPANTSIIVDMYTLTRKSPIWGEDGDVFRPERFQDIHPTDYRYNLLRFGFGPRKCVGQHFGDKIVRSALFELFRCYVVRVRGEITSLEGRFLNTPSGVLELLARE